MQLPYAYDYIELLQEKLKELQQMQQELMDVGMNQMMQGGQQGQQQMLPQNNSIRGGLGDDELASLEALEAEESGGVDERRLLTMLEQS